MNYFDEATSFLAMIKMRGLTQSELATLLKVSQPYIANKLRLLKFTDAQRQRILSLGLTERHARTLLRLNAEELPLALDKIELGKMTTAQTEIMVDSILEKREKPAECEYDSTADRLYKLEAGIEQALVGFRRMGIACRVNREIFAGSTYINICIGRAP